MTCLRPCARLGGLPKSLPVEGGGWGRASDLSAPAELITLYYVILCYIVTLTVHILLTHIHVCKYIDSLYPVHWTRGERPRRLVSRGALAYTLRTLPQEKVGDCSNDRAGRLGKQMRFRRREARGEGRRAMETEASKLAESDSRILHLRSGALT